MERDPALCRQVYEVAVNTEDRADVVQNERPVVEGGERPVRVIGRLDYGFRIDDGVASFLRIEQAVIEWLETPA